jgi:uncharacterized membrane protein
MSPSYRKRVVFLDLMRALAVLMMVQGHTIDTFLGDQFRTYDSSVYNIWLTIRGFTAPIFMFTSGVTFTYLLKSFQGPFFDNPRVYKGLKRFFVLVLTGYLLRFPTAKMFDFSEVGRDQWLTFFSVDALHLIGFGLLFILCLTYIADRYKFNDYKVLVSGIVFFLGMFPITDRINWANHLPIPFAAYLYQGCGSLFPFFPWAAYVISGAMLGLYIARNPECYTTKKISFRLFWIATALLAVSIFINQIDAKIFGATREFWTDGFSLVFYRISIVLFLNGAMSFVSLRIKKIPDIVKNVGKNTLLIYVVHIVILYGSAWIPGMSLYYAKSFDIFGSLLAAGLLIALMFGMVAMVEFLKDYRKRKLATAQV